MKKIAFFLFLGFLVFLESTTAQLSHPHFVSVNFGTNIPLSDYKEADSLTSGSANTGLYYSFEAGAFFSKVMGVGLSVGAFNNSSNEDDIKDQLKKDLTNTNGKFEVSSDNWNNGYIMVGPYLSFGTKKFIVDAKVLAGVVNTEKPIININSSENGGTQIQSNQVTSIAFGVNYGLHFRIKLVGKLALRINAEGLLSSQEFENKVRTTDASGTTTRDETIKKEIHALNLGAGLAINF